MEFGQRLLTETYSADNLPTEAVAAEILRIFRENYPKAHSDDQKKGDLERYATVEDIMEQIISGNDWVIGSVDNKIVGALKVRLEQRLAIEGALQYLVSWTFIDKPYRGQGLSKELLMAHLVRLSEVRASTRERVFSIGDVHANNSASLGMCRSLGYEVTDGKDSNHVVVYKEVVE